MRLLLPTRLTGDHLVTYRGGRDRRRPRLQSARRPHAPTPARSSLRARRALARRAGVGPRHDPLRCDEAPTGARGGGARRHAPVGPGEAPLPEPGADPPDPRPLDRQVHRAPRRGARRPQARPGGVSMTTTMATEATTTQVYRVFIKAS